MIHVTKQLAIKLKEVGYDVPVSGNYFTNSTVEMYFDKGEEVDYNHPNLTNRMIQLFSAPTLYEAQDYLRDKHGLHVCIQVGSVFGWSFIITDIEHIKKIDSAVCFDTHPSALAAAIERAVDIVKNGRKVN